MFLLPIKLDRVSFKTKGRQNLQKTADFLIESIVFCPLVPPSWISLVDPTSAMYASAIYVSYIYGQQGPIRAMFFASKMAASAFSRYCKAQWARPNYSGFRLTAKQQAFATHQRRLDSCHVTFFDQ